MDILTVLEAAHAPLTLHEIKEYCGVMFSEDRLNSLIRSGDIKQVPGVDDLYWCVPSNMKKQSSFKKCPSPIKTTERSSLIKDITNFRERLITITRENNELILKKDTFPTKKQEDDHIQRLHDYNELKDYGMSVIGHIAEIEGAQTKEIYERYGLTEDD